MTDDAPILLDVSRLVWRRWRGRLPTGIDRACLAYLRHFAPKAQAVIQHDRFRHILDRDASRELFALLDSPGTGFKAALALGALQNFGRWSDNGRSRPYLNIGHTGLNSNAFREWIRNADVKPVYLVHDLIPITHPEYCRAAEAARHRERMQTVLTTAAGVIGNSQATLDELAGFARAEELPSPPGIAAWLGSEPLRAVNVSPTSRPTFVTVGTIEARKNHLLLLEIWSRIVGRLGSAAPRLLIIGQRGWEAESVFELLDRNDKLRGHVVEMNNCSDEELAGHLATARALLFPSHAEGYGLPLIEALGLGAPVIASDLPVFRELAADIPTYLSPLDSVGWEAAILDYSQDASAAREAQVTRMKSFSVPDWVGHFDAVEGWLHTLGAAA
ncbi:glycosyltransferase family 4 protein [Sphingomonas sp.]|uniref:glycosyltransferase family 4 protein n=1 Tax=Sphingomonas sp. TaxID=28214 RepID=UPI0038AAC57B